MLTIFKYLMYLNSNFLTLKIVLKSKKTSVPLYLVLQC